MNPTMFLYLINHKGQNKNEQDFFVTPCIKHGQELVLCMKMDLVRLKVQTDLCVSTPSGGVPFRP